MLARVLEPEVMDSPLEAADYDAMDHQAVNRVFVDDLLAAAQASSVSLADADNRILDLGTGTAQIPIELLHRSAQSYVLAIDLAASMLELGRRNIEAAGLSERIELQLVDAKRLPFADGQFGAMMSNSIVHHIPDPLSAVREACRVLRPGGLIFFRDLLRPRDDSEVAMLVETYAGNSNAHQRQLFEASLRAALNLDEVRDLVASLGFDRESVRQTSDRHWTWSAVRN